MRHRKKKVILDRATAPRRALLQNLAVSLILYERITTTDGRARAVRPLVERVITKGKANTLAIRRQLIAELPVEGAVRKVLEVLGPRYQTRRGGYLRMVRLGGRRGDGAKITRLEFIA